VIFCVLLMLAILVRISFAPAIYVPQRMADDGWRIAGRGLSTNRFPAFTR
jgi:hypothetical protein